MRQRDTEKVGRKESQWMLGLLAHPSYARYLLCQIVLTCRVDSFR